VAADARESIRRDTATLVTAKDITFADVEEDDMSWRRMSVF